MPTHVATYLGIDIAKVTFHACLLRAGQSHPGTFDNTPAGFKKLANWLKKHKAGAVHACLEATGRYGEAVAEYLYDAGHTVSVINPARLKGYVRATQTRTKTDPVDAALLAEFCQRHQPQAWTPPAPQQRLLRELVRRRVSLLEMRQQERNRQQSGELPAVVQASLESLLTTLAELIKQIEQAMRDQVKAYPDLARQHALLTSIPGVGQLTATALLGEINFTAFDSARQLAAHAGLTPSQRQSGTSGHGPAHLSKQGQVPIRRILFMPAMTAKRFNPTLRAFADQLKARGKAKMVVTCAVMRKLLHLCYGVLKSGQPFDPTYPSKRSSPAAQPVTQTLQLEVV